MTSVWTLKIKQHHQHLQKQHWLSEHTEAEVVRPKETEYKNKAQWRIKVEGEGEEGRTVKHKDKAAEETSIKTMLTYY